jgi:hypothetical protein
MVESLQDTIHFASAALQSVLQDFTLAPSL